MNSNRANKKKEREFDIGAFHKHSFFIILFSSTEGHYTYGSQGALNVIGGFWSSWRLPLDV